jgi:PAT family beta-lactamase induction signal transducer AmpG
MLTGAIQGRSGPQVRSGNIPLSWMICFAMLAGLMILFSVYHFLMLPRPVSDQPGQPGSIGRFLAEFFRTFAAFFRKEGIGVVVCFLLFYRFAEAQLVKMTVPFLLDPVEVGGLGLTTGEVGLVYGTVGIIALLCGGVVGGIALSRHGLRAWLWPMMFIMHLPDAAFVYLANAQPASLWLINACVAVEQFGYGFGFAAYVFYMIYVSRGPHPTAHYAICSGFMALGMMVPGMWSGWLQEQIGYAHFFLWVMLATLPGFAVVKFVRVEAEFGRRA